MKSRKEHHYTRKYFILGNRRNHCPAIIIAIVFAVKRNNNIKKNGIETDAVVSRIKENETRNDDGSTDYSYTYYVKFTAQDGQVVEAKLGNAPRLTREGDRVRIKYLPEKPKYAIIIK